MGAGCGLLGLAVARLAQLGLRFLTVWVVRISPKAFGKVDFSCFFIQITKQHTGVSKNRGTPKSTILIGFSIINHPFWGFSPYFWKHPYINRSNIWCIFFFVEVDSHYWWRWRGSFGNPQNFDAKFWGDWKCNPSSQVVRNLSRNIDLNRPEVSFSKECFFFSISENRQPVILKEPASSILLRINLAKQLTRIS